MNYSKEISAQKSDRLAAYKLKKPQSDKLRPKVQRVQKKTNITSVSKQGIKQQLSLSKQYGLTHSNKILLLNKDKLTQSQQLVQGLSLVQSVYFPPDRQTKASTIRLSNSLKKGLKSNRSEAQFTCESRNPKSPKVSLKENDLEEIYRKCSILLSEYEQKVSKLQKQKSKLIEENKKMKKQIKANLVNH